LNNHTYRFGGVVIGGDLKAVQYSCENNYPLILNRLKEIYSFDPSCTDLRDNLLADLSLKGLNMFANKVATVRVGGDNLIKVVTQNSRVFKIQYDKLYIFDDQNVEGIKVSYHKGALSCRVLDWYDIQSCAHHDIKKLTSDEDFVKEVHFVEGGEYLKDRNLVAVSYLDHSRMQADEGLEIYVRYKVLDMMRTAGIRGRKNGINKETGEHYRVSIKLAYKRREVVEIKDLISSEYDDIVINPNE
tara:strand:+ start:3487 stop:4218 length:732 start_codon:yes stop_codon:yes gene_type:complete